MCSRLLLILLLEVIARISPALAEDQHCAGSSELSNVQQVVMPIPHTEGHMLMISEDHGSVDTISMFADAVAVDHAINQLDHGNGHGSGYFSLETEDGAAVSKWKGSVKTLMKDGLPVVGYKGTWRFISGTGKFTGISGMGTYHGYFTAENTRIIHWKGTCILTNE